MIGPYPIGFGASGIGNLYSEVSEEEADEVLAAAFDAGMRYFDTAPLYGHGLSELRLGRFLRTVGPDNVAISTKVGRYFVRPPDDYHDCSGWAAPLKMRPVTDYSYDGIMRSIEQSICRLGISRFERVFIHDVDRRSLGGEFEASYRDAIGSGYRALRALRDEGVVKKIGIGINEADVAARFIEDVDLDCVMLAGRFTLLEQATSRDLLERARERNIEIIAAGVFNSGILAGKPKRGARFDYQPAPKPVLERAGQIYEVCERHGVSVQAAAIQFPLAHAAVHAIVLGMSRPERIRQNLDWLACPVPGGLWQELADKNLIESWAVPLAGESHRPEASAVRRT